MDIPLWLLYTVHVSRKFLVGVLNNKKKMLQNFFSQPTNYRRKRIIKLVFFCRKLRAWCFGGLPNQSCSMTDSSVSQIHQTFFKNDLSIVFCAMISNLETIIMITTEYAKCDCYGCRILNFPRVASPSCQVVFLPKG